MPKLNIWFMSAHEQPGGQTSRTFDYCLQLLKRGHQTTIFTNSYCHRTHVERLEPGEKWRVEHRDGVRIVWVRTIHYSGNGWKRGFNMISFAQRVLGVYRELPDRPDVVVGDSVPPAAGWVADRVARAYKAALVYQIRDVWPLALVYDGGLSRHSPIYYGFRWVEKKLYQRAHRICATMPHLHPHVQESGSDPAKIRWVPNGVNLKNYPVSVPPVETPERPMTIMYAGAFGNAHDVITIVRAAKILRDRGVGPIRFRLIGDGVKRQECEELSASLGLDNIQFQNSFPKDQVPDIQKDADVLVACVTDSLAYKWGINLNKIYDYFATGRAVVFACRTPNDPVAESGCGFSVPPEDPEAMAEAFTKLRAMSREERVELGRKARAYAESNYDVDLLADRMETMLLEACEAKKASA